MERKSNSSNSETITTTSLPVPYHLCVQNHTSLLKAMRTLLSQGGGDNALPILKDEKKLAFILKNRKEFYLHLLSVQPLYLHPAFQG